MHINSTSDIGKATSISHRIQRLCQLYDGIDIIDIIDNAYEAKGIAYEQFESFAIPEFLDIDISDACEQFYTFVNHNSHLKEYVDTCIDNENGVPTLHGYMYFREHQTNTQEINDQMSM